MASTGEKYFYKGNRNILADKQSSEGIDETEVIRKEILQIFDIKNLSFLLGAGCSSYEKTTAEAGRMEIGIPRMSNMADEFYSKGLSTKNKQYIISTLKVDVSVSPFNKNLEKLLEVLYSHRFLLEIRQASLKRIDDLIDNVKGFLLIKCMSKENGEEHNEVVDLYKLFYKKLIYRDNNLSKTNIFTTNYDLYSENALDELGILYSNGFSGVVQRYFNPAVFNYAYAEQMELSNNKWNVIDNFIYLYKLHGSVNWIESDNHHHLFKVKEVQVASDDSVTGKSVMIYPTPMKQSASLSSPYSDLFREFQKKLMQDKNVLVVIGYSFSDEHINNIIYQALTIPNFRLVIFFDKEREAIAKLIDLNDPRIWIIGGIHDEGEEIEKIHYFKYIVNSILPDIDQEKIEESVDKVIKNLLNKK